MLKHSPELSCYIGIMLAVRRHTRDMAHKIRAEADLVAEMRDGRGDLGGNDEVREISTPQLQK